MKSGKINEDELISFFTRIQICNLKYDVHSGLNPKLFLLLENVIMCC